MSSTTTTRRTTDARDHALALLQLLDPQGEYTDERSAANNRQPARLWEAIRSASSLVEDDAPPLILEVFRRLSDWAHQLEVEA